MARIGHQHSYIFLNDIRKGSKVLLMFQCIGCHQYRNVLVTLTPLVERWLETCGDYVISDLELEQLERESRNAR